MPAPMPPEAPVTIGSGGLDLGCSAERVLGRIDVLAARETGEDFRWTMADAPRLDVEQIAVVGLQRVADVAERGAVGQHELPVGARSREQRPGEPGTGERAAGLHRDASPAAGGVAEVE